MSRAPERSARLRSIAPPVHRLGASPAACTELEWFFNASESDMGAPSNFFGALGDADETSQVRALEDRAEAIHRHRRIRERLLAIPDGDAGVLQAAYEIRPWPPRLRGELKELTGVVVRLACAAASEPVDRPNLELAEMAMAKEWESEWTKRREEGAMTNLRRRGTARFLRALQAYERARNPRRVVARRS